MGRIARTAIRAGRIAARLGGLPRGWIDLHKAVRSMKLLAKVVPGDEDGLRREYAASDLSRETDSFVLYRIVGNDLWPRHEIGQSLANLEFILKHEPELEGCEKRWVVNRVMDPADESAIIGLLQRHGRPFVKIPFVPEDYREVGFVDCTPPVGGFPDEEVEGKETLRLRRSFEFARLRLKNNYVMNNNGARNVALRDGRARAKWILRAGPRWSFSGASAFRESGIDGRTDRGISRAIRRIPSQGSSEWPAGSRGSLRG
jgi:hypothetical protein